MTPDEIVDTLRRFRVARLRAENKQLKQDAKPVMFYHTFTDSVGADIAPHTPDIDSVGGGWTTLGIRETRTHED